MIRYNYNTQVQPAAPFVRVIMRDPVSGAVVRDLPAQLDTAADRTVIPEAVALALGLHVCGQLTVVGFASSPVQATLYSAELGVHTDPPVSVEVIASPNESWVLLGRDVLNGLRVVLDGPGLALEIG